MNADPFELKGGAALGDALERLVDVVEPRGTVAGWASVELDRAEIEVTATLAAAAFEAVSTRHAPDERLLGARCRVVSVGDGVEIVLLEPSTEGLLAAALAHRGEGWLARYLFVSSAAVERARGAGLQLGPETPGPFGPERLVRAGPRWGPFLLLAGLD